MNAHSRSSRLDIQVLEKQCMGLISMLIRRSRGPPGPKRSPHTHTHTFCAAMDSCFGAARTDQEPNGLDLVRTSKSTFVLNIFFTTWRLTSLINFVNFVNWTIRPRQTPHTKKNSFARSFTKTVQTRNGKILTQERSKTEKSATYQHHFCERRNASHSETSSLLIFVNFSRYTRSLGFGARLQKRQPQSPTNLYKV